MVTRNISSQTPTMGLELTDGLFINEVARDKPAIALLARKLADQAKASADYARDAKDLSAAVVDGEVRLVTQVAYGMPKTAFKLRPVAHQQMSDITGIPQRYYDRMKAEAPDLLVENLNRWLGESDKTHLVRTYDDTVRAVMSNRYRPIDNVLVFKKSYETAKGLGADVIRVQLSESRFYEALVRPDWAEQIETKGGYTTLKDAETISPLITITNSEVGRGGLSVSLGAYWTMCRNHMVWEECFSKIHMGSPIPVTDGSFDFRSDETRELQLQEILSTVADAVRLAFNREKFDAMVAQIRGATELEIKEPTKSLEQLSKLGLVSDDELEAMLNEFAAPTANVQSPTVYGLMNAITFVAQSRPVDRGMELEKLAGQIVREPELVMVRRK